jgi:MYXO-CTERM domain-containing protein
MGLIPGRVAGWTALVVLGLALLRPAPAQACSCLPPPTPEESLGKASVVFEGIARMSQPSAGAITGFVQGDAIPATRVSFEVKRRWKGDVTATFAVLTPDSSATCGRDYLQGATYIVYAQRQSDGAVFDLLCSRSRQVESATDDLAKLGAGTPPLDGSGPGTTPSSGGCQAGGPPGAHPGWLTAALALTLIVRRHRRSRAA